MDIISFNEASTANGRIEKFITNPDNNSGVVTIPKTIESGNTITIPAGRIAVLPNVQVDGTLNIEGEVFIPAGATFSKVVETKGNQTIDGVKTFSSSPIVPIPTTNTQAANKAYVDSASGGVWSANDTRAKTALNASGESPIYACRAWVNFDGTGTVAIRASGNVSSITDNGTGQYTINFSFTMPDDKYNATTMIIDASASGTADCIIEGTSISGTPTTYSTTALKVRVRSSSSTSLDCSIVNVSVFR